MFVSDSFIVDNLMSWSQRITQHTLLIVDNCDGQVYEPFRRERFILLLRKLIKLSKNNLSIIITSEQHIFLEDDFEKFKIGELSKPASIELLRNLAPNISTGEAEIVVDSVERCPLALKVLGRLIHSEGKLTQRLADVLQASPLKLLNKTDSTQKQRFWFIMTIALKRIVDNENSIQCGHFLSLFPGSFQYIAALSILPGSDPEDCVSTYVERSLLDEYSLGETSRYKMHKLIKEYFRLNGNDIYLDSFKEKFGHYFSVYVLEYANLYLHRDSELNSSVEHEYNSETHNIRHLLDILLSDDNPSLKAVQVLAFSVFSKKLTRNDLKHHFQSLMESIIEVCNFLGTDNCFDIYPDITKELLQECKCINVAQLGRNPCSNTVWCRPVEILLDFRRINEKLDKKERNYLERLNSWYCLQNTLIYKCQRGHLLLTMLLFLTLFAWYKYHNFFQPDWVYCLTFITFIVCVCNSLMIPVLALTEEDIVHAETIEVSLLLLDVYFISTYTLHTVLKYFIWSIIILPLITLASKDHLDLNYQFLGRLIVLNSFQLIYMSHLYCRSSKTLLYLIKCCTVTAFFSLLATWIILNHYGSIGISGILSPYIVSCLLNMITLLLWSKAINRKYVYFSFVILTVNLLILLPWNTFIFSVCF